MSTVECILLHFALRTSWQYRDRMKPKSGLVPVLLNDFKDSFWIVHVTVDSNARAILLNGLEHCIGHTQPHHHDEKHPARPGFEPGTSKLRAT